MISLTDKQFRTCEDKIDAMRRKVRARTADESLAIAAWDEAYAMPQVRAADRKVRDVAMTAVALRLGLLPGGGS